MTVVGHPPLPSDLQDAQALFEEAHRRRRRRRVLIGVFLAAVLAVGAGVLVAQGDGTRPPPQGRATNGTSSPLSSLTGAIRALLTAPNFTIVTTESAPLLPLPGSRKMVTKAVIEKPDRISISGQVIAIGSVGYFPAPPGKWTMYHHVGEARNYTNDVLLYLHVLDRATAVIRHGDTYIVPPVEVVNLLDSTSLPEFHNATGATWSATVRAGSLQSMTLHYDQQPQSIAGHCGTTSCTLPASPVTVTTTVSRVGTSPTINPPAHDSIVG